MAEPNAAALAVVCGEAIASEEIARRYGEAGYPRAVAITWDGAIERLVG